MMADLMVALMVALKAVQWAAKMVEQMVAYLAAGMAVHWAVLTAEQMAEHLDWNWAAQTVELMDCLMVVHLVASKVVCWGELKVDPKAGHWAFGLVEQRAAHSGHCLVDKKVLQKVVPTVARWAAQMVDEWVVLRVCLTAERLVHHWVVRMAAY